MDHQKFGKRVQEFLRRKGLRQNKLADRLDVTPSFLSRMLTGESPLTPDRAKACILYLADTEAIIESGYVDELLELAGCEDFSPTDWMSWPLKHLAPSEAGALRRPTSRQQTFPSDVFDSQATRRKYLECVVRWYQSLTLPAGSQKAFALQSVFQPLQLRREIFFAEDLPYEDRRALLDEPMRSEDDPRWAGSEHEAFSTDAEERQRFKPNIATDGSDALSRSPQRCMVVLGSPGIGKMSRT